MLGALFSWEIKDVSGTERGLRGDKKEECETLTMQQMDSWPEA